MGDEEYEVGKSALPSLAPFLLTFVSESISQARVVKERRKVIWVSPVKGEKWKLASLTLIPNA